MAQDWGDILRSVQGFAAKQILAEEKTDIGEDNEDYVENMFRTEETIANAGLTNQLSSRTTQHPWLPEVRHTAIHYIVHTGGPFGVKKVTVYTAVVYFDRFLSSMPIQVSNTPSVSISKLLGVACLYLAVEQLEENEDQPDYESSTKCSGRIITKMRNCVVKQFRRIVTFVTPIQFIRYFLSRFCRDLSRTMYAKSITVELIMSILGDVRLMSLRAFVVGAAATLLASNSNILTHELIRDEINALPQNWLIPLDEARGQNLKLLLLLESFLIVLLESLQYDGQGAGGSARENATR
ncbi:cyclin-D2-2-like [Solanum tuberosum]|uniref:cyclin-D2-2-like n=1 Tax=Solanum tuberosum TaxID=4113 RepID=UPI00073A31AF|nr:PREDICTED: cyclin-D2-2-like [Solanum tuberosum]